MNPVVTEGMTPFQIISVIISVIVLLGTIVGLYVRAAIAIAKIEVEILQFKRDLIEKEKAICNLEKFNREDHKEIIERLNDLIGTK
jgi:hypothetical protein